MRLRRPRPPEAVVRAAALGAGERLLASAAVPGGWALVSTHALHVVSVDEAGPTAARSVRWTDVHRATAVPAENVLDVQLVDGARWSLPVGTRPGRLPEAVRERVQNSVVVARRIPARGGGIHVVARRTPEQQLSLQVFGDPGVDVGQPDLQDEVSRTAAAVRSEVGIPPSG